MAWDMAERGLGVLQRPVVKVGAVMAVLAASVFALALSAPVGAAGWEGFSLLRAPSNVGNGTSPAWAGAMTTDLGGSAADIWSNNHHLGSEALIDVATQGSSIVTAADLGAVSLIDSHGASFTDIDGDGDEDLVEVMGRDNENRIFKNVNGSLVPIAPSVVSDTAGRGRQPLMVDFDGDGDMDIVVTNLDRRVAPVNDATNSPSAVYLNNGDGTSWTVAANPSGALSEGSLRLAQLTSTGPGTEQIIITHNSFSVATDSLATGSSSIQQAATSATGRFDISHVRDAVLGDFDGDLHPELVIARGNTSVSNGSFPLQIFDLVEGGSPVSAPGLPVSPLTDNCRSVAAGDFDNDGDLDIFGGCSQVEEGQDRNVVLLNDGAGNFTIAGTGLLAASTSDTAAGLAVGDLNDDGWLDVWIGNGYDFEPGVDQLAMNNGGVGANYLSVELVGSNPDAAGAQVFVGADEWQVRETGHRTRRGQDARALHFGLGAASEIAPLQIMWPDGSFESCTVAGINRTVEVRQGSASCTARTAAQFRAALNAAPSTQAGDPLPVDSGNNPLGLTCDGELATIVGTNGADRLVGTAGVDVIVGLGGNDTIIGFGSADVICGGSGDDTIQGNFGFDRIFGQFGNDSISGGYGNDFIEAGYGNDVVDAGNGADTVLGGAGRDEVFGSNGADRIFGGVGADFLQGGAGNDYVASGAGNDVVRGNLGEDTLIGGAGADDVHGNRGNDRLFGGSGNDTLNGGYGQDVLTDTDGNNSLSQ